jgi:quercetin dioxygenase-like cupin family protein
MRSTGKAFVAGTVLGMAVAWSGITLAQSSVTAKYRSTVVLENDRVRVKDVTFPPGVRDTGMHTHDVPHVGIILTAGSLVFTEAGKPVETAKYDAGSVGFREAHVTHQVANPGSAPMRVIEVELK